MTTQLQSNFPDFFGTTKLPELGAVITVKKESYPSMIPFIFNEEPMDREIDQATTFSGLRNPSLKQEGQPVSFQTMFPGFDKTYTALSYATGYRITKEMVRDGKINMIKRATDSFAKGMYEIRELKAAQVFDDGFTVNGPDGVPLFSAVHPLENGGGAVGANRPAAASVLSTTSFKELRNIMQNTVNEQGQRVKYMMNTLLVPQALQDTALEIIKSSHNPNNANNTINTLYGVLNVVPGDCWQYLESDTAWFILASKMDHNLKFRDRQPMEVTTDYDKYSFAHEIIADCRFDQGYDTWRGVYGNPGA